MERLQRASTCDHRDRTTMSVPEAEPLALRTTQWMTSLHAPSRSESFGAHSIALRRSCESPSNQRNSVTMQHEIHGRGNEHNHRQREQQPLVALHLDSKNGEVAQNGAGHDSNRKS